MPEEEAVTQYSTPTLYEVLRDHLTEEDIEAYGKRHAHADDHDALTDWLTAYISSNESLKAIRENDTESNAYKQAVSISTVIYENEPEVIGGEMTALEYYRQAAKDNILRTQIDYGTELESIYETIREQNPLLPPYEEVTVGYSRH